jgi:putative phosphoesterase
MRIAIISDMHGNCIALDAVLADLQQTPIDRLVCLGDAVQGGPQPAQVTARLRELGWPVVMGNADAWLLTGEETGQEQISSERLLKMQSIREWSLSELSNDDRAFIAQFRSTVTVESKTGQSLLCFHGSPNSFDDVILPTLPEEAFQQLLGPYASSILTGGHTHLQQIRRIGDSFFFNPGSTGFAYSPQQDEKNFRADPWAEYAVLTVDSGSVYLELRRIPFDVIKLRNAYFDSGRPYAAEAVAQYEGRS